VVSSPPRGGEQLPAVRPGRGQTTPAGSGLSAPLRPSRAKPTTPTASLSRWLSALVT